MRPSSIRTFAHASHRGIALLSALVCLVILSAVVMTLSQTVIYRIREGENHQLQLQADALVESALVRARLQRSRDPSWSGETWTPQVPGQPELKAVVQLQLEQNPATLRVTCIVSSGIRSSVQMERSMPWPLSPASKGAVP